MARFVVLILLSLLTVYPSLLAADHQPADSMPRTLFAEGHEFPIWVDEREVLLPTGKVNPTLFHPIIQEQIEAYLQLPVQEGKIRLSEVEQQIVGAPSRPDLKAAVETSAMVFVGKVTGISQGFQGEVAGSLLRIVPARTLKGAVSQDHYFVFFPVGEVHLNGIALAKADPRYPDLPVEGDFVAVFVARDWRNTGSFLWLSDDGSLLTLKDGPGASLPRRYRKSNPGLAGARREVVEKFIESVASKGREQ